MNTKSLLFCFLFGAFGIFATAQNNSLGKNDPDAIAPMSTGRASVLNTGYCGPANQNVVKLLTGTGTYFTTRGLYVLVRQRDVTANSVATGGGLPFPWQTGGTKNWVQTLFSGPTSWVARGANNPLIASAGLTPSYSDLGLAHS